MDYYDFRDGTQLCARCGWTGTGAQAQLYEIFDDGAEYRCPTCRAMFGFYMWPTAAQVRTDPRADPIDRLLDTVREERIARHEASKLVSVAQLPELDPAPERLAWDVVKAPDGENEVHIRHGAQVIWRELSWHGNDQRFAEIARLLKQKYGDALRDMVPTENSLFELHGDRPSARDAVAAARAALGKS